LDIDSTAHVADIWEGCVVKVASPIDGSTDGGNLGESVDDFEFGVVGDEECSLDLGE